jgi:hypothetical protein
VTLPNLGPGFWQTVRAAIAARDHFIRFVILLLIMAAIIIVAYDQVHHTDHGGVTCIHVTLCDVSSMNS